ncbi:MAG: branched-chain amino acid transport system permease protein [Bradyrhizobium sp.]|jgi:branched-chain amino acid transport system permease protein|nr:branched-chain amino acid transport system permease protein [Bradyrhizobium sp.]
MSGYLSQVSANLLISVIIAYAAYVPLATGQLNLGVAGFMCVGAYASAVAGTMMELPLFLCVIVGVLCAVVAGLLVAVPVARMDGIYFSLATFAFAEVVTAILVNIKAVGAASGYVVVGYIGLNAIALTALLVIAGVTYMMSTRIGLVFTAVRNDERAAAIFGVGVSAAKVLSFVIGAALAGLAGSLYAHHYSYVEAQNFNFMLSATAVLFALLGGIQTSWGPLLGASAITLLPELLRTSGEWRYIGFGAIMIVLMVLRPDGVLTRATMRRLASGWRT